jgi:multicomponent Na+:H+ antiporter subunit D
MMLQQVLIAALLAPFIAIAGILIFRKTPNIREAVSIVAAAVVFGLTCLLYEPVKSGVEVSLTLMQILPGIALAFKIEPLGQMFAMIASFLWGITVIYAIGYMRGHNEGNQTRFYSLFALAIAAVLAIAFAENLFTLFVFYEVLTLSTYPLVTHAGTDKARLGGRTYLGILLTTSIVFFLTAIIATYVSAGTLSFTPGGVFDGSQSTLVLSVILVLFVFGIGKAAMMPFHRWLPAAMVAPTPVSSLLHAVAVVKAGVFSLLKVCLLIFGFETLASLPITDYLLYLAAGSALLASIIAMRKENLKARLAYSTVSQLAYVSAGALMASESGANGSALHILMHAFGKITLFFCAGAILVAHHKTEVSQLVGIGRKMPVTMTAFFVGSVCIIGLPPTGGSWSKWYLLNGALESGQWPVMVMLLLGSLISLSYLMPIAVRAFFPLFGDKPWTRAEVQEAPWPSLLAISLTSLGCVMLFLFPDFINQLIRAGIQGG